MEPDNDILAVNRSKAQAQASYNRLSRWYDLLAGIAERPYKQAGLEMLAVQPGERILEIGFGTGACLLPLARSAGPDGAVCGIDLSTGMLAVAEGKLKRAGLADRVSLTCGDAAQLPYPDSHFEAIYTSFTLELFDTPEIPIVLAECRRVLRPNGRLGVVAMSKRHRPNWITRMYEWVHCHFEACADCRPICVRRSLEAVGFRVQSTRQMSLFGLPVDVVLAQTSGLSAH